LSPTDNLFEQIRDQHTPSLLQSLGAGSSSFLGVSTALSTPLQITNSLDMPPSDLDADKPTTPGLQQSADPVDSPRRRRQPLPGAPILNEEDRHQEMKRRRAENSRNYRRNDKEKREELTLTVERLENEIYRKDAEIARLRDGQDQWIGRAAELQTYNDYEDQMIRQHVDGNNRLRQYAADVTEENNRLRLCFAQPVYWINHLIIQ
jgi:hypothetical protein